MSHNIHAQRKEQESDTLPVQRNAKPNYHTADENQCLHTLTALADYTSRLPKTHGHYTVRNNKTCHAGIHY